VIDFEPSVPVCLVRKLKRFGYKKSENFEMLNERSELPLPQLRGCPQPSKES
jgi:hypothetical protein